jgi:large subunit ribosomal protein L6
MLIEELAHTVPLPEGVSASYDGETLVVEGPRGKLERSFSHPQLGIQPSDGAVVVSGKKLRKRQKALLGTWRAHLANMVNGVAFGFRYQMKVVFAHFPMKVSIKGDTVVIDNFLGEKASRHAEIAGGAEKVKVKPPKGDSIITIEGNDRELVGQTAANLERATIVKGRDIRVFQDGIYRVSKEVIHDA